MKITKIHGKYYDLQDFKHPGGNDAIWHSYERDATAMFEQYHSMANQKYIQQILHKYEVPKNKIMEAKKHLLKGEDNVPQFNFNSEFAKELKKKVKLHFIKKAQKKSTTIRKITKASYKKWLQTFVYNLLYIISAFYWLSGYKIGLLVFPLCTYLNIILFHEACHFSISDKPLINKIYGFIFPDIMFPKLWFLQHNISHHSYTNIKDKDVDLYHGNKISRESHYSKYNYLNKYQSILFLFKWFFYYKNVITNSFRLITINKVFGLVYGGKFISLIQKIYPILYISFRYVYLYYYFEKSFVSVFLPSAIFSFLFMLNVHINHFHQDTFYNDSDWYKHQVLTSSNHSIGSTFGFIFSIGLNYQIEHHLFPNINHCHYPDIQPIVKSICKKHNITYKEFNGYYDALCSYYNHIKILSKKKK